MHSNDNEDDPQAREWTTLYKRICATLARFGREDSRGRADYWVLDDNWDNSQQKVLINNLEMLRPEIVRELRDTLTGLPGWSIVVAVDIHEAGKHWPAMGLIIRTHEIIDGLQRQYFPAQYRFLRYADSRPGADLD